ncbi:MAG: hypothetical protein QNJ46_32640 [Leptolyngbyaceae cyanobacterium MO_188.B28]|nr:hypothetical protein [Leptolyngbyaceae cyanobacterium MO_188.B28]
MNQVQTTDQWETHLDAVIAAPESHIVLYENDDVRVLRVVVQTGDREPYHTHKWPSIFIMLQDSPLRYYDSSDQVKFESDGSTQPWSTEWMDPEALHSVENFGDKAIEAIRIELKKA